MSSSSSSSSTMATATVSPPSSASRQATTSYEFPDDPFSEPARPTPYLHQTGSQHESQLASSSNDSLAAWAKTTRFNVLNHFSHVTNVARNGAHNLLSSPLFQPQSLGDESGYSALSEVDKRRGNHRTSAASLGTSFLQHGPVGPLGPSDPGWIHSDMAKKSGTGEYDSARVYLAKWAKMVAEEGEINRIKEQDNKRREQQSQSSLPIEDSELGAFEIWDLLPCIDKPMATRVKGSEINQEAWSALFDDSGRPAVSFNHMKQLVFQHGFGKGKHNVNGTGWEQLGPRAECWSFLLGAQEWTKSEGTLERKNSWDIRSTEYWNIRTRNEYPQETNEKSVEDPFWREQKHRIRVDCLRVDKKLPLFRDKTEAKSRQSSEGKEVEEEIELGNIHIHRLQDVLLSYVIWDQAREDKAPADEQGQLGGYVQGMSDLCAPLYSVCHGDEAKTFWLFAGLMNRMRRNFYTDQSGMKMQLLSLQKLISVMDPTLYQHLEKVDSLNLFFCFRWLLVCFKREFSHPEILMLWEAIWAANLDDVDGKDQDGPHSTPYKGLSNHFQLFIALAILEHHRDILIKHLHNFDELLQYMNGLSFQIDVDTTIAEAEVLCLSLHALIEEKERPDSQSQATTASLPTVDDDLKALVIFSSVS